MPPAHGSFRTGVSLHSHTLHSREYLTFLAPLVRRINAARRLAPRDCVDLDLERIWWTPPLGPRAVLEQECDQIRSMDLEPLVSITDHDDIEAPLSLRAIGEDVPVSTEWTVPCGPTSLHLGVHNIPHSLARNFELEMRSFTRAGRPDVLHDVLASLRRSPGTLVVLNHPLWDELGIGRTEHDAALRSFLERHGSRIDALELNGLRSVPENRQVERAARQLGLPVVAGGDRHGVSPNAILNLTSASTFAGFCEEVRRDRVSRVVFMPRYCESRGTGILRSFCEVLRNYREHSLGWQKWSDRVFVRTRTGHELALSAVWTGGRIAAVADRTVALISRAGAFLEATAWPAG